MRTKQANRSSPITAPPTGVSDTNDPEAAYPLTYEANGGAFDDGNDTLKVKDLSGKYQLTGKAPTHDSVDLDGTSVPVLFIG